MALSRIQPNAINKDDNGIEMFFGTEQCRYSVDLNGTGDYLTIVEDENGMCVVEDDTMGNHIHFSDNFKTSVEIYIEVYEEIEGSENLVEELNHILQSKLEILLSLE
jgi:hypothetical protein